MEKTQNKQTQKKKEAEKEQAQEKVESFLKKKKRFIDVLSKYIVGLYKAKEGLLVSLLLDSHVLIEGVPGLAKTSLGKVFAKLLDLDFKRIQFTPDLMPSDIIGYEIFDEKSKAFKFIKGPVFTNILLADEINRAIPKTQSALLEAMEEKQVTVMNKTYFLDYPFMVIATQNPIEQDATYPLPEAQKDRFLMMVNLDYPSYKDEMVIASMDKIAFSKIKPVIKRKELNEIRKIINGISISKTLLEKLVKAVRLLRPHEKDSYKEVKSFVKWGPGPRAVQHLVKVSKVSALLDGRLYVEPEDIKAFFFEVLSHRLILNFEAVSSGISIREILSIAYSKI